MKIQQGSVSHESRLTGSVGRMDAEQVESGSNSEELRGGGDVGHRYSQRRRCRSRSVHGLTVVTVSERVLLRSRS